MYLLYFFNFCINMDLSVGFGSLSFYFRNSLFARDSTPELFVFDIEMRRHFKAVGQKNCSVTSSFAEQNDKLLGRQSPVRRSNWTCNRGKGYIVVVFSFSSTSVYLSGVMIQTCV